MSKTKQLAAGLLASLLYCQAAFAMSTNEASALVKPFYDFLSNPGSEAAANSARDVFHDDWQSYYSDTGSKGLDGTIKAISGFSKLVPDLNWEMKDVKVAGDTIIVRGEATGTPAGDFFGVPHGGGSFNIMSIDMHTVKDGKVIKTYHIEDWRSALKQLKEKK